MTRQMWAAETTTRMSIFLSVCMRTLYHALDDDVSATRIAGVKLPH